MKNILLIGTYSTEGGISKNFETMGNELAKICNLYTVTGKNGKNSTISQEKGRLVIDVSREKPLSMISYKTALKVKKFAQGKNIDGVIFLTDSPINTLLIHALKDYKELYYLHNPLPHVGTSRFKSYFHMLQNKTALKYCNRLAIASNYQLHQLENNKYYKKSLNKIKVIYLGPQNEMLYDIENKDQDIDVLFFGRLEYYKGIDVLIDAMADERVKRYSCYIIGKGDLAKACKTQVKVPSNVHIINKYEPDQKIAEYVSRSKIVVLPYREATGTQIVQNVFYYGRPVIATKTGCFPEYIDEGKDGLIVKPDSKKELVEAISYMLSNNNARKSMGENAKKSLNEKFSNKVIANEYIDTLFE